MAPGAAAPPPPSVAPLMDAVHILRRRTFGYGFYKYMVRL
jgi:hypothetical protein